jgi:hypothetical protein
MAGRETLFLCHMPMLRDFEVHMYQLVMRATIPGEHMRRYREEYDKADTTNTFFLVNTEHDLMTILDLATGRRASFTATLWDKATVQKGKKFPPWWKGPEDQTPLPPLIEETRVTVDRVVYFRHFDLNLNRPQSLTYVLFGLGDEAHLHHYQTAEPDFDEALTLAEVPGWLPDAQLEAGIHINFPAFEENAPLKSCGPILEPGSTHLVQYCGIEGYGGEKLPAFEVKIGRNLWFNTSIGNTDDPCGPTRSGNDGT